MTMESVGHIVEWDRDRIRAAGRLVSAEPTYPRFGCNRYDEVVRKADALKALRTAGARADALLQQWMHVPTLKLRAGEMSAQETRTVLAVLQAIRAELQAANAEVTR